MATPSATHRKLFAPLFDLYLSGTNCDLVLLSSDGVRLNVHSVVIAASFPSVQRDIASQRTPGILSCLQFGKSRKKTRTIAFPTVPGKELRLLVRFAYLGVCELGSIDCDDLVGLLNAAHSLGIDKLVSQVCAHFQSQLTPSAASKLFEQGITPGLREAFDLAEIFLLRHLTKLDEWDINEMRVERLSALLKDDRLNVEREEDVWHIIETWVARDKTNRVTHLEQLVRCLRKGFLTEQFKEKNELVKENATALNYFQKTDSSQNQGQEGVPFEFRARIPHQVIIALGGMNQDEGLNCNPVQHLEFYNINLNAWCKVNGFDMPSPRSFFAGEILDECKLHLFGGFNGEEFSLKCQKFDLMSGEWSDLPQMAKERVDRCYASATEMDGEIYVSGGHHKRAQNKARSVEKFNPVVNAWSQVPNLTSARCEAALVNLNGCLYVIGGFDGVAVLSSVEKLEPDSRWTFSARMIRQRSGLGAVALPGCILVFGGHDGFQRLADGEKFNPDSETWTLLAPMVQARSNFGIASIGRLVFAVGGYGGPEPGQPLAEVEAYDPSIDKWFPVEKMLSPRSGLIACVADNLQLALKVWGTEERKGCVLLTSSLEKDSHQQEHAGGLSTPMLDPLPNGWLQNNTNENA